MGIAMKGPGQERFQALTLLLLPIVSDTDTIFNETRIIQLYSRSGLVCLILLIVEISLKITFHGCFISKPYTNTYQCGNFFAITKNSHVSILSINSLFLFFK